MRYLLIFWALPLGLFWGWYGLSYHDINFGLGFFSREMNDLLFRIYGDILGIDPAIIPGMVARAACSTASSFWASLPSGADELYGAGSGRNAPPIGPATQRPKRATCPARPEG